LDHGGQYPLELVISPEACNRLVLSRKDVIALANQYGLIVCADQDATAPATGRGEHREKKQ
ncbi:MAG: hypothetical protein D3910_28820, partial [Candidatus Electrothrix sp. ATG2]|nr:hypothetical protein [Candidatus Electrothrix sp. ATG2]